MKSLEIILRVVEYVFTLFLNKKAQDERNALEANPGGWFKSHFGGMPSGKPSEAAKADARDSTQG